MRGGGRVLSGTGGISATSVKRIVSDGAGVPGRDGALQRYRRKKVLRRLGGSATVRQTVNKEGSALKTILDAVQTGKMCDDSGVDNTVSETLEMWRRDTFGKPPRNTRSRLEHVKEPSLVKSKTKLF